MPTVYLAFYYDTTNPTVAESHRYLGAFPSTDDVIGHMNETSSGNKPFKGGALFKAFNVSRQVALTRLNTVEVVACNDFDPIIIFVASVTFTGRTKAIYVSIDPDSASEICTASITKMKNATYTIPIAKCPMCSTKCVAADDDGHCSYECATGT
jgi:hypothetical protein